MEKKDRKGRTLGASGTSTLGARWSLANHRMMGRKLRNAIESAAAVSEVYIE